jgi:hypothetical protein
MDEAPLSLVALKPERVRGFFPIERQIPLSRQLGPIEAALWLVGA